MQDEFEMSLIEELNYFLWLQIKQLKELTFVCQAKYCHELFKRFGMADLKFIDNSMPTNGKLDKYVNGKGVDVKMFRVHFH